MLEFLKYHPFPVKAHFKNSLVLTFAVPIHHLINHIPKCLTLDTFKDKWAFIAIAMVSTKSLRPVCIPKIFGNNFFLIGYRIFVRYKNMKGKNLRGLYILKSETDKKKMEFLGNLFTHYNYTTTDINVQETATNYEVSSKKSEFSISVSKTKSKLPPNSPFKDWKEARKFAGPLPHTFTYLEEKNQILIIKGLRQNWTPKPVEIISRNIKFLNNFEFKDDLILANAFMIENIPYQWQKGITEQL